jgi:fatty-acyl-CoA synthase
VDTGLIEERRSALERSYRSWRPASLAERFDSIAQRHPDRPFVITAAATLTYAEVRDVSRRLAAGLLGLDVQPGDRVAMLLDNRSDFVAVKLAIARVGAVAVPLNYSYRAEEIRERLADAGACVLVAMPASMATDFLDVCDRLVPGWERGAETADLPLLRRIVLTDAAARPGALDLAGLAELGSPVDDATVASRQREVSPDQPCDIVYTSGTTGHALGAVLTHDMVLRSAYGSAYHRAFADGWRVLFSLPMYHVFGYVEGLLAAMFAGGAVVPLAVFNPRTVLDSIERHRVNEVLLVPTMTVAVVEQAAAASYDLSSLESVMSAAAPAPAWLWNQVAERLAPSMVFTGYGQTEVSAATTLTLPQDPIDRVSATVGTAKLGGLAGDPDLDGRLARYRTIDPFTGAALPPGAEGELAVRGPIVSHGYYGDEKATTYSVDPDGWLRTGDLGRVDEEGYVRLTGRSRELYKVGGELVAPAEVERVITGVDGVEQAYVAGVPDDRFGEVGWAWVTLKPGAGVTGRDVVRECHQRLAPFKVPRGVTLLSAADLPMTATGKVQKDRLVAIVRR